jgi:hypothetical protein
MADPLPPSPPTPIPDYNTPARDLSKAAAAAGMNLDQITAIKIADVRAKKIRRIAATAYSDGAFTAFFAFCCLCCICFGWVNLVLAIAFGAVAYISFKNAAAVRKFDIRAPRRLALNQFFLAGIIILYCLLNMGMALWAPSSDSAQVGQLLAQLGIEANDIAGQVRTYTIGFYGLVILGTVVTQGLMAAYYFSRTHLIEEFLEVTPKWVVDFRRTIPR